ncbi:MAG: septal ring lytic transglycosylase RlpA family protein [Burkholderiales bacterium]|nr:septal ring lytic transglycosylase RlpA family protein [Burkholderiales bacterium]
MLCSLVACSTRPPASAQKPATADTRASRPGAYYKDDGPAAATPGHLDHLPDAQPRVELLHRFANRPYTVFGVDYVPMTSLAPLRQRGAASWYGRKFHGQKTAIGEIYDMFAMTAAHPTAPLPSYARVSYARTGRSVIVRINDRGPFHAGRIVDLSYAAAHRLGIAQGGSGEVEFELLLPPYDSAQSSPPAPVLATAPTSSATLSATQPAVVPATASAAPLSSGAVTAAHYVQLGAFGNYANAQVFQQRMSAELAAAPHVQQIDGLFRVRLGPFSTREAALEVRDRAQALLGVMPPIISTVSGTPR